MSSGGGNPVFTVIRGYSKELHAIQADPYVYYAQTQLQFCRTDNAGNHVLSSPFPFRLDTAAALSIIPEQWLDGPEKLRPFVATLGGPVLITTQAGHAYFDVATGVSVRFLTSASMYQWDFLISTKPNAQYGLISLRDVRKYFNIASDFNDPYASDTIELQPR